MSSPPSLRPQLIPWPKPPQKWQDSRSSSYRDHNAGLGYESMPGDGASSGAQLLGAGKERVDQFPPLDLQPFPQNLSFRTTLCPTVVEVAHIGVVEIRHRLGHGAGVPGPVPQPPARRRPPAPPLRACCASTQLTTAERRPRPRLPRPLRATPLIGVPPLMRVPPLALLPWPGF